MGTKDIGVLANEAERLAAANGHRRTKCQRCHGQGVAKISDANAVDGWRVIDPCFECEGLGWMWFDGNETLEFARRRSGGLLNMSEVIERFTTKKSA